MKPRCLERLFVRGSRLVLVDGDADHASAEDHPFLDESLKIKFRATTRSQFRQFRHDEQAVADKYGSSETDFFHATEAQKIALEQFIFASVKPGQLRSTFAEDHARHEGEIGHVTPHPEFIRRDVFISDQTMPLRIDVEHGRQLLHFEPLRIDFPNLFDRELWPTDIKDVRTVNLLGRHNNSFSRGFVIVELTLGLASTTINAPERPCIRTGIFPKPGNLNSPDKRAAKPFYSLSGKNYGLAVPLSDPQR